MNRISHWIAAIAALALLLLAAPSVRAQEELVVTITGRGDEAFRELGARFAAKTGRKVTVKLLNTWASRDVIVNGDPIDVGIVEFPYDAPALESGNVVPNTATPVANGTIGLVVRKGAPKPDISTPAGVKRALLAAKTVAYPDPEGGRAGSGVSVVEMLRRLGIHDEIESKSTLTMGGPRAMALVASGAAEIGMTYMIGIGGDARVDLVGALPGEICPPNPLIGFVSTKSKNPKAAKELLDFLASPEAAGVYPAYYLQPAY
jgi:molybdate transport system substrate-binding protein